jgi:hypothetical protein
MGVEVVLHLFILWSLLLVPSTIHNDRVHIKQLNLIIALIYAPNLC